MLATSPFARFSLCRGLAAILLLLSVGSGFDAPASAGTIYWNMQTLAATSNDVAGLVVGNLTRGQGGGTAVTGTASSSMGRYTFLLAGTSTPASGGQNAQSSALGGPLVTGSSAYFSVSLSNTSANALLLTGFGFGSRSTSTGPAAYALRSSRDDFATTVAGGSDTLLTTSTWAYYASTFSTPLGLQPGSVTELRLYGWGGSATNLNNLTWRIDDLHLVVVPEPGFAASAAGFVILSAIAATRRSRGVAVSPRSRT